MTTTTTSTASAGSAAPDSPTFDPQYYQPSAEQFTRNDNLPPRVTLTRFLSQYVKDHPEVRGSFFCCWWGWGWGKIITESRPDPLGVWSFLWRGKLGKRPHALSIDSAP